VALLRNGEIVLEKYGFSETLRVPSYCRCGLVALTVHVVNDVQKLCASVVLLVSCRVMLYQCVLFSFSPFWGPSRYPLFFCYHVLEE